MSGTSLDDLGLLPSGQVLANKRVNLTGRPGTRLAVSAPPHISSKGLGQGARPSRPAGYAQRSTEMRAFVNRYFLLAASGCLMVLLALQGCSQGCQDIAQLKEAPFCLPSVPEVA